MTTDPPDRSRPTARTARLAVTVLFFTNGATFASMAPRLPEIRDRLDLGVTGLGLALAGIGFGGLVGSVVSGRAVGRLGSRRVGLGGAVVLGAGLPLVAVVPDGVTLFALLAVLGVADAWADVGMNIQAIAIERAAGRPVLQGVHGWWSAGTLAAAAAGAFAAGAGVPVGVHLGAVGLTLVVMVAGPGRHLDAEDDAPAPSSAGLGRMLGVLGLTGLAVAVVEAAPTDWAAVFATEVHESSKLVAGLTYAAFTACMLGGRLVGDRLEQRLGDRLAPLALAVAAAGYAVVGVSPHVAVAVAGFALCGAGASVLFPALYRRAGTTAGVAAGTGMAAMTSGARIGFLAGPIVIGAAAGATELRIALPVIALVACTAALRLGK